jgi:hypothetical protein
MLLINKITLNQLTVYRKDVIKCLKNNINNTYIDEIIVFLDIVDENLPNHNKVRYITKPKYNDLEIIEYSKKISNSKNIIFSKSLYNFGNELRVFNVGDYIENSNFIFFKRDYNIKSKLNIKTLITKPVLKKEVKQPKMFLENKTKLVNKLDVIIVSVNYNDYLSLTLEENVKVFNNITVVTSKDDIECQNICKKFGVNCIISKDILKDGLINKSIGLNKGIKSLNNPDWILVLDADIVVKDKINIEGLNKNTLYTNSRWIIDTIDDYNLFKIGEKELTDFRFEKDKGIGFFQLFNYEFKNKYPDSNWGRYSESTWSDVVFKRGFNEIISLDLEVIHVGKPYQKWNEVNNLPNTINFNSENIISSKDELEVKNINTDRKIVVYTCISGGYDKLKEVFKKESNISYICFTDDNEITSDTWDIRKIPEFLNYLEPTKRARCLKILPHLFLNDYDVSVWVDGAIEVLGNINELVSLKLKNNFAIPKHPDRLCVYDEGLKVVEMNKDKKEIVNNQLHIYKGMNYPEKFGLVQSNVIIRNHNEEEVIKLCELWWNELLRHSKRDQLSFNFSLWLVNIEIDIIEPSIISSKYFQIWTHVSRGSKRAKLRKKYDSIKNYINGKEL